MKDLLRLALVTAIVSLAAQSVASAAPPVAPRVAQAAVSKIRVPDFAKLYAAYPQGEAEDVKQRLGGHINAAWITNTCTIRLSRALNYSGIPVPGNFPVLSSNGGHSAAVTVTGADNKRHMIRVREMWQWVSRLFFGKSIGAKYNTGDLQGPPPAIAGKKGILYVKVDVWSDATGHFGVWDGANWLSTGSHDQMHYFGLSSGYEFWESGK